jgi:3'-5' exoribonuclease
MGERVMVRTIEVRRTKKNDRFASLRVSRGKAHGFDEIEAKVWGLDQALAGGMSLPAAGEIIELIDHREDEFMGRPQWVLRRYRVLNEKERAEALAAFVRPASIDEAFYRRRLDELIDQVPADSVSGRIVREIFDSAGFRERFHGAPAAIRHHQNYPGGLLEHTINVTTLALTLADAFAQAGAEAERGDRLTYNRRGLRIDRAVLIAAGLLHDIGKLDTYRMTPLADVTEQQSWEGHLPISYAIVRARAEAALADAPSPEAEDEARKLLHCILSHHGQLEFGSPVMPACAEAFILSQADMTDARLAEIAEGAEQALREDAGARWLARNQHFPGGVFIGDWPPPEAPKEE